MSFVVKLTCFLASLQDVEALKEHIKGEAVKKFIECVPIPTPFNFEQ